MRYPDGHRYLNCPGSPCHHHDSLCHLRKSEPCASLEGRLLTVETEAMVRRLHDHGNRYLHRSLLHHRLAERPGRHNDGWLEGPVSDSSSEDHLQNDHGEDALKQVLNVGRHCIGLAGGSHTWILGSMEKRVSLSPIRPHGLTSLLTHSLRSNF